MWPTPSQIWLVLRKAPCDRCGKRPRGEKGTPEARRKALPQLRLCRKTALISQLMEEGGDSGQVCLRKEEESRRAFVGSFLGDVMFDHQGVHLKASGRMEGEEFVNNNYHIMWVVTVHLILRKWKHISIPTRFASAPQLEVHLSVVQHTDFEAYCRSFAPARDMEYLTLTTSLVRAQVSP